MTMPASRSPSPLPSPSPSSLLSPSAGIPADPHPFSDSSSRPAATASTINTAAAGAATSSSTSATSPRVGRAGSSAGDDIEMEPISGHRRRKSSVMSFSGFQGAPTRPGIPLHAGPGAAGAAQGDEAKIVEENGDDNANGSSLSKDESGRDSFSDEDLHDDEETGLTDKDRRRRQKKKRQNTRLDQRVVREKDLSSNDRKEADKNVAKRLSINALLIFLWYAFSLSISLYNKWMFDEDSLDFAFPLFTTSLHMLVQFGLAGLVLYFVPKLRPNHRTSDSGRSRHESEPQSGMTKMFYLTRIGPCGAATGLDIGLGNTSLKFITLTFYTMCKSSSLAFVLIFAFIFRLESPTIRLVAIIATMTLGVILMVSGEVEFKLGGFVLVISAAFFSGLRWSLTQILLLRNRATSNPFSSIFFLTPVMFFTLLFLAIPVEGFGDFFKGLESLNEEFGVILTPLFLLFPGCLAFLMTAAEFALLQRTSVVTLSIAGIFKEVVTISAASVVFKDTLTLVNTIGLFTTMAAIIAYNYIKITKMRQEAQGDVRERAPNDSPPSGTSDAENDEAAEELSGLLRQSFDADEAMISSDGDIQHNLVSSTRQTAEPLSPRRD